ncbi:hypothetical protein [Embleya sp. NPDC005575]|uniref:hypothetical protein n=1 Tax=Embleya sp. NPDC005575 TaxID=3156892 RepID=UPI0033A6B113
MTIPHGDAQAHRIVGHAVTAADKRLGNRLQAAFCIGSLAHGGFTAGVSDIDVALIVSDVSAVTAADIEAIDQDTRLLEVEDSAGQRLSFFWDSWSNLADNREGGRFPAVDRADFLDSGFLYRGEDLRSRCTRPSSTDMARDSGRFLLTKFGTDEYIRTLRTPDSLIAQGRRATTKAVLFPVRMVYTIGASKVDGNDPAAGWFARHYDAHAELVSAATQWRNDEDGFRENLGDLMRTGLIALYKLAAERIEETLTAPCDRELQRDIRRFRVALDEASSDD